MAKHRRPFYEMVVSTVKKKKKTHVPHHWDKASTQLVPKWYGNSSVKPHKI